MMRSFLLALTLFCSSLGFAETPGDLEKQARDGWARVMKVFYSPKTSLIYACAPGSVTKSTSFQNGIFYLKDNLGYGMGMEDCAIVGGVALSMLCDQYLVTQESTIPAEAKRIAEGLCNLVTAHGYPGFVARGLCVDDGKSICALSSRDQVTHFIHGLWRYYHAPFAETAMKEKIRQLFRAVSSRMEKNVTPENNYNFLQADGSKDPRGICKMWKVYPHEAARLPMIYAATWDVTGDEHYRKLYKTYIKESIDESLKLAVLPQSKINALMPNYTLLQMNTSFEVLLNVEKDPLLQKDMKEATRLAASMAEKRAPHIGSKDGLWLCSCGEVALAQLMSPGFPYKQRAILSAALLDRPIDKTGSCRAVHLGAAYWRLRLLGK